MRSCRTIWGQERMTQAACVLQRLGLQVLVCRNCTRGVHMLLCCNWMGLTHARLAYTLGSGKNHLLDTALFDSIQVLQLRLLMGSSVSRELRVCRHRWD